MSRIFSANIDLFGVGALIRAKLDPVSADPSGLSSGDAGRIWYNSTSGKYKYWTGTGAIDFLDRANHTGSQLASTISDLSSTVKAYRLDEFAAPTAAVSLGNQRITNQADPTSAQDSATKNYVDSQLAALQSGQVIKGSVKVAATSNVSLSAPGATIDGVTMVSGDVVLLTAQSTATQNGPYVWTGSSTALTRATNWDTSAEAVLGSYWIVQQGTNADTFALLSNDTAITLGTTAPAFVFRGAASVTYSGSSAIQVSAGVISVILATSSGLVTGSGLGIDTTVVGRKVTGSIPASSSGIFSISGSTVTINHALNNTAVRFTLRAGSSPISGVTSGQLFEVDESSSDANNLVVTLPAAPATNNWVFAIVG